MVCGLESEMKGVSAVEYLARGVQIWGIVGRGKESGGLGGVKKLRGKG